ncbi:hypothetical protein [Nonomuraea soli]|uniref:Uncharacterized protein n=1 Tax=Nonomuraea soli TaxID=1032476 RepID=A0A7W0CMQ7_9ACTN|nr:hypothetical protein [Nonomuraea soli]MBA2893958.1 hypothetical protein [Nonomuraea soli]
MADSEVRDAATGCAALLAAGAAILLLDEGMAALVRTLHLPVHRDASLLLAVGATVLGWQLIKARRSGKTIRAALGKRRQGQRAWWAALDADNLRLAAAETGSVLCFAVLPALVPMVALTGGHQVVMRVWPPLVGALVAWWLWQDMGPRVRQAGPAAWGNAAAAFAALAAVTIEPGWWLYALAWGVAGWLVTMPYTVPLRRTLKREGRLIDGS